MYITHWILQRTLRYRIDFVDCVGHRKHFWTRCVCHRIGANLWCGHLVDFLHECLIAFRVFSFEVFFLSGMRFAYGLQWMCANSRWKNTISSGIDGNLPPQMLPMSPNVLHSSNDREVHSVRTLLCTLFRLNLSSSQYFCLLRIFNLVRMSWKSCRNVCNTFSAVLHNCHPVFLQWFHQFIGRCVHHDDAKWYSLFPFAESGNSSERDDLFQLNDLWLGYSVDVQHKQMRASPVARIWRV